MAFEPSRRPSSYIQPPQTVRRHPVSVGIGAALLLAVAYVGISYMPDLVRYMKIKSM